MLSARGFGFKGARKRYASGAQCRVEGCWALSYVCEGAGCWSAALIFAPPLLPPFILSRPRALAARRACVVCVVRRVGCDRRVGLGVPHRRFFQLLYVPSSWPIYLLVALLPSSSLRFSCLKTLITCGVPTRRRTAQAKRTSPLHLWQARLAASLGKPPLVCLCLGKWHHAKVSRTKTMQKNAFTFYFSSCLVWHATLVLNVKLLIAD